MARPPPITDDRAQPVPIFDLERMRGSPALSHPETAFVVRRAGAEFVLGGRVPLRIANWGVGLCVFVLFAFLVATGVSLLLSLGLGIALFVLFRLLYAPVLRRTRAYRRSESVIRQVLRVGVCPSCGYDLAGLPADGDGCVRCAECGSAWRADRIGRAEPLDKAAPCWTLGTGGLLGGAKAYVRDARDRRVPMLQVDARRILKWDWPEHQRPHITAAIAGAKRATRISRWAGFALMLCVVQAGIVVFMLMMIHAAFTTPGPVRVSEAAGLSLVVCIPLYLFILLALFGLSGPDLLKSRRAARAFAWTGICPSCFADLTKATPEPDGCALCPGCGAAWRLSPGADAEPTTHPR